MVVLLPKPNPQAQLFCKVKSMINPCAAHSAIHPGPRDTSPYSYERVALQLIIVFQPGTVHITFVHVTKERCSGQQSHSVNLDVNAFVHMCQYVIALQSSEY